MEDALLDIQNIKKNLEISAYLVSKGNHEREVHGSIIECLVILAQLETKIKKQISYVPPVGAETTSCYFSEKNQNVSEHSGDDIIAQEVKKVKRRLPRWFRNSNQNNSQILFNYLNLYEINKNITQEILREKCDAVQDFYGNYNQMKNFGEKNHGKVFEEKHGVITLWEPVKDLILSLYHENSSKS